jgi:multiple sugar transport system substrate-binding protein
MRRPAAVLLALLATAGLAPACGGGGEDRLPGTRAINVWILENEPDRVAATRRNLASFTTITGIPVRLTSLGDDELTPRMAAARRQRRLPDVVQLPLAAVHAYADDATLDTGAAQDVVRQLGYDTFSQSALSLVSRQARIAAVPSDGWGQLLIYRKDLFRRAGLPPPRTLPDIQRAAAALDAHGLAGITLATVPGETFTAQSFEQIALAAGCRVVDDVGRIGLTTPDCRRAFRVYVDLARHSVGGNQDADTTRDAYFAGRAAMILWSPFLLDAMAGLRDDARPTCRECRADPAFLARNSGLVGALAARDGAAPVQYGEVSSWGIVAGQRVEEAKRFVEYMLTEGYVRWLALSPQGKYPVRTGGRSDPQLFADAWARLDSGVDRKAPLRRFYSEASIQALGDGVRTLRRWGIDQGQAQLLGLLSVHQPFTVPLAAAVRGQVTPDRAAEEAQAVVARVARAGVGG